MAEPSGFGLLGLFPGIVEEPGGFTFYRINSGTSVIEQFIQSATGAPKLVYSVLSGSVPQIDLITGSGGFFSFGSGRMIVGAPPLGYAPQTGQLNVFWEGDGVNRSTAGILVQEKSNDVGGAAIALRSINGGLGWEDSISIGRAVQLRTTAGVEAFTKIILPRTTAYSVLTAYGNPDFSFVEDGGGLENGMGHSWGFADSVGNLVKTMVTTPEYTEVGYSFQDSSFPVIGGNGAFVLRHSPVNPTTAHPSGTTFYSKSNGELNVRTSSAKNLQLAPGITGIDRLAHSTGRYTGLTFTSIGSTEYATITSVFDGKIVLVEKEDPGFQVSLSGLPNGFSCEVLHLLGAGVGLFTVPGGSGGVGEMKMPGEGEKTFINVYNGKVIVSHSRQNGQIYIPAKSFTPLKTSGCVTGLIETPVNKNSYDVLNFPGSGNTSAETTIGVPAAWEDFDVNIHCCVTTAGAYYQGGFYMQAKYESPNQGLDLGYSQRIPYGGTFGDNYLPLSLARQSTTGIIPANGSPLVAGEPKRVKLKITRARDGGFDNYSVGAISVLGVSLFPRVS